MAELLRKGHRVSYKNKEATVVSACRHENLVTVKMDLPDDPDKMAAHKGLIYDWWPLDEVKVVSDDAS